jgi:hypothetical protein
MSYVVLNATSVLSHPQPYVRHTEEFNMAEGSHVTAFITNGFRAEGIQAVRNRPGN